MANPPVDLNRIRDFLRIVEHGNITRAAQALGERKAKLSRSLALLEQELGVQLVYRTTRQFRLTSTGADFFQKMREYIGGADQLIHGLATEGETMDGSIRVTAPEDMGHLMVTPLVNEFSKLHPQLSFELIYTNEVLDLVKLGIDIAFRIGNLRDSTILQRRVSKIEFILVASPAYLGRAKRLHTPDDLHEHATIAFGAKPTRRHTWAMSDGSTQRNVALSPIWVANNYLTLRDLTQLGRGVSFLPRFLAQPGLSDGSLAQVLTGWRHEGALVHLAMPAQKKVAPRIRRFFDFAVQRL